MNKEQLQQKIANMEAELASMKALLNKPEPTINYWQPSLYQNYYIVKANNCVYLQSKDTKDEMLYKVFQTEAEAQKYADYIKAEETIRKAIAEANEGWLPDWSNSREDKRFIHFKTSENKLYVSWTETIKKIPNFMYIKDQTTAIQIAKNYEQELITYLSY